MTYNRISRFAPINDVDNDKVKEIAESIKANGYVGCPTLSLENPFSQDPIARLHLICLTQKDTTWLA